MKLPLEVPHLNQPNDYTCGPTVLTMICRFYGITISLAKMIKIAKPNQRVGTIHTSMLRAARRAGLTAKELRRSSFKEIRSYLTAGISVVVQYEEPDGDQHYAAVTRISDSAIYLQDPWHGDHFRLSRNDFMRRWRDRRTHSVRWALVLRPRNKANKR